MRHLTIGNRIQHGRVPIQRGIFIEITENKSGLGKKWIAKQYRDGELIASYPADKLCEIDLTYFVK